MGAHASGHHPRLAHQFDTLQQQRLSAAIGMWAFLANEVLFFGAMFAGYTVYRFWYLDAWDLASRELDLVAGTINTFVLLTSSLTMAFSVDAAKQGDNRNTKKWVTWTIVLGAIFLLIKAYEYYAKWEHHMIPGAGFLWHGEPSANAPAGIELFFSFYFVMTGFHALHMVIGFGLLGMLWWQAKRNTYSAEYYTPVEMVGLYWHFVDIVWVFLFPLLYLIDRT